ncbi:unnamed protein product [Ectocarpus sp. CCAP 1310/34]|nr:unnamed protein product [Ectocarpus sp. CCAP 1310/34]
MGLSRKKRVGLGTGTGMSWKDNNAFADDQANLLFLESMRERIDAMLSSGTMEDGLALGACSDVVEHALSFKLDLGSGDTVVILPGYEGLLRRPMCVDVTAQALLNGADSADGGGKGIPFLDREVE